MNGKQSAEYLIMREQIVKDLQRELAEAKRVTFDPSMLVKMNEFETENLALALQVKQLRECLRPCALFVVGKLRQEFDFSSEEYQGFYEWANTELPVFPYELTWADVMAQSKDALSFPDNHTEIINRHDAEVLERAAKWFGGVMQNDYANPEDELRRMAQELRGKE